MFIAFSVSGLAVGMLVGLTGVGGGALMTPLLTLLFGFSPAVAVGTDLAFASITKTVGTAAHRQYGHVRWEIVRLLCIGCLPSAALTVWVLHSTGGLHDNWASFIKQSIGMAVLLTVLSIIFRKRMLAWLERHPRARLQGRARQIATLSIGIVLGTLVTLTSIGAGAVGATLILLLYPELKPAEVAGTDIAYAVPLTAVAGLGHAWLGTIDWLLLAALLTGSIPGIWLGARLARSLPEQLTRHVLATALTLTAIKMVV